MLSLFIRSRSSTDQKMFMLEKFRRNARRSWTRVQCDHIRGRKLSFLTKTHPPLIWKHRLQDASFTDADKGSSSTKQWASAKNGLIWGGLSKVSFMCLWSVADGVSKAKYNCIRLSALLLCFASLYLTSKRNDSTLQWSESRDTSESLTTMRSVQIEVIDVFIYLILMGNIKTFDFRPSIV